MIGLGELLWDLLPTGKVLGGAPANFAYMATVLGDEGIVASRIGSDDLGREALNAMEKLGLPAKHVQVDDSYPTGTARVVLDANGQPNFSIEKPVAWDSLQWSEDWKEVASQANVVCFGTLAQRSELAAATIERFLRSVPVDAFKICDANLREPFYTAETLRRSFAHADMLKLNDQELASSASLLGLGSGNELELAGRLTDEFDLDLICITRGARGSVLFSRDEVSEHAGYRIAVADAVGAGDAFTACVAHFYIQGRPIEEISEYANRFASWVATQTGATPSIPHTKLAEIFRGGNVNGRMGNLTVTTESG
jgi:fructokinase